MKNIKKVILLVFFISFLFNTGVFAENDLTSRLLDDTINSVDAGEVDFEGLAKKVSDGSAFKFKDIVDRAISLLFGELNKSISSLIKLVSAAVLTGILCNLKIGEGIGETASVSFFACYSIVAAMIINSFYELLSFSHATIDSLKLFMQSLLPALTAVISAGASPNVAAMSPPLFIAMQIITNIAQNIFLPLIFTVTSLSVVNNLSGRFHITRLIDLLRQFLKWSLGLLLTIFVGLLGIQGISSSFLDGIAGKTVRYALCNFVPIVGGVLADSASAVLFSAGIVKNTIGIAGVFALVIMCAAPLAKISALGIIYRLAAGICEPATDKRIVSLLSDVAASITQIFGILLIVCVMFIISIAMLCMLSGIKP